MNPRRILVALVLALFASGMSTWLVSRKLRPSPPESAAQIMYVAPSRSLGAGEILRADNTELVSWPGSLAIDGGFLHTTDLLGREILFPLAKGEPILDRDLSASGSGTGLASKIPNGMRAVALRSDEVVGVGGFLVPGSHLDVLATYRSDKLPEPLTATVLQNVVVVAAGHQVEPDPQGKPSDVAIVTLLLNPEQSQRAVLASSQGSIHFALRNGSDGSLGRNTQIALSQLAGPTGTSTAPHAEIRPMISAAVQPRRHEIETILGGDVETRSTGSQGGVGQ
jgi:pilus assembly protein CpaB